MTPQDELQVMCDAFSKLQDQWMHLPTIPAPEREQWQGDEPLAEASPERINELRLAVQGGFLNLISRQLFWIQNRMVDAGMASPAPTVPPGAKAAD